LLNLTNTIKVVKKNKVVLITGAASGLGKAVSIYLATREWDVIGTDKNKNGLESLKKYNINTRIMDISQTSSVQKAFQAIEGSVDGINGIVNNAGIFDQIPMVEGDMDRFEKLINTNVLGAHRVTHVFFPLLYKVKGRIINISSETAKTLLPFQTYGSSKYMMEAWNNTLRMELKLLGMHVSLIRAGGHMTPLMDRTLEVLSDVPEDSLFENALKKIKETGGKKVQSVSKDPVEFARVVYKALNDRKPRRIYSINESYLYTFLSLLPRKLKESLVLRTLKG
jgi:short-subunit dehydrogenase